MNNIPMLFWLAFGLLLVFIASLPRARHRDFREEYKRLLSTNKWINFANYLKCGRQCFVCGTRNDLQVHHTHYLKDYDGSMIAPWNEIYLHLNMLKVVCGKCHQKQPKAQWKRLRRVA